MAFRIVGGQAVPPHRAVAARARADLSSTPVAPQRVHKPVVRMLPWFFFVVGVVDNPNPLEARRPEGVQPTAILDDELLADLDEVRKGGDDFDGFDVVQYRAAAADPKIRHRFYKNGTGVSTIASDPDPEHWRIVAQDRAAGTSTMLTEAPITPQ